MKEINDYINQKNDNMSYVNGLYNSEILTTKLTNEQKILQHKTNKEFIENILIGVKNESK